MTDPLIRDVPDDIVAALDAGASRRGLSEASTCAAVAVTITGQPAERLRV